MDNARAAWRERRANSGLSHVMCDRPFALCGQLQIGFVWRMPYQAPFLLLHCKNRQEMSFLRGKPGTLECHAVSAATRHTLVNIIELES
jgi:hypothetical protein